MHTKKTHNDKTQTGMTLTAISRLSIIRKCHSLDKIKENFFLAVAVSVQMYGCTTWTAKTGFQK